MITTLMKHRAIGESRWCLVNTAINDSSEAVAVVLVTRARTTATAELLMWVRGDCKDAQNVLLRMFKAVRRELSLYMPSLMVTAAHGDEVVRSVIEEIGFTACVEQHIPAVTMYEWSRDVL